MLVRSYVRLKAVIVLNTITLFISTWQTPSIYPWRARQCIPVLLQQQPFRTSSNVKKNKVIVMKTVFEGFTLPASVRRASRMLPAELLSGVLSNRTTKVA